LSFVGSNDILDPDNMPYQTLENSFTLHHSEKDGGLCVGCFPGNGAASVLFVQAHRPAITAQRNLRNVISDYLSPKVSSITAHQYLIAGKKQTTPSDGSSGSGGRRPK
jgi:hypothetical protein